MILCAKTLDPEGDAGTTTTGVPLGFCPGSRLEDVRRCKERDRRGLSWTSAKKRLAKTVALGEWGEATDCAGVDSGAIREGSFLPVKATRGCKTVASAYFCGCVPCTQYDPKVILGAKALDPKGDAYYGP